MLERDLRRVNELSPDVCAVVLEVDRSCEIFLEDTPFFLSFPGKYPCARTAAIQFQLFMIGRRPVPTLTGPVFEIVGRPVTKCDGYQKISKHQTLRAVDSGLRHRASGRFYWYGQGGDEADALFLLVADEYKAKGAEWGGDWEPLDEDGIGWDPHHFQWAAA